MQYDICILYLTEKGDMKVNWDIQLLRNPETYEIAITNDWWKNEKNESILTVSFSHKNFSSDQKIQIH